MDGPIVTVTRLRRHLPVHVVLLHGLFANAGYWLPYLEQLQSFRVSLLGIDYEGVLDSGMPLSTLAQEAELLVGDGAAHLACHSFGCIVAPYFSRPWLSRTFLCPTFAALSIDRAAFCAAISERLDTAPGAVSPLLERALERKRQCLPEITWAASDIVCLPADDPYFSYAEPAANTACQRYRGGHWDVSTPVADMARRLGIER